MMIPEDLKTWCSLSCPTTGLRFDARTLEFMDTDRDGRIRVDEVRAAFAELASAPEMTVEAAEKALAENLAKQADLAKLEPSAADRKALADWESAGSDPHIIISGLDAQKMSGAEAALAAVEPVIDAFFTPPDDMPLVTEAVDVELPLGDHLNPKHQEAVLAFAEKCVRPVLGEKSVLGRLDWKAVKSAFAPYRAWRASKPVLNATAMDTLVAEERKLRYRLHLEEFLANFVTMDALYGVDSAAVFQTGVLRIDGKELHLCFHVENEAAHAALAERSKCCVVYVKLSRSGEAATRQVCAVVTAGRISGLYTGRNGVFFDRDGKDWEAVVTKVIAAEVSLAEAFWAPWRTLGESVTGIVKKFFSDRDTAVKAKVAVPATAGVAKEGGAAMASSVAAIGIGVGMLGAAAASLMAALSHMTPLQILGSAVAIVFVVSLPSVVLTWFSLRRRDLGAILNACGWAVNRPLRFSAKRARAWTKCAPGVSSKTILFVSMVVLLAFAAVSWYYAWSVLFPAGD